MEKEGTILIVDDNRALLAAAKMLLKNVFEEVFTLSSPKKLLQTLSEREVDVVLLDMNFEAGLNTGNEGGERRGNTSDGKYVLG